MLTDFLAPIDQIILNFKESLPENSIGKKIDYLKNNDIKLSKFDIAIIGINEYRGSSVKKSNYFKTVDLRKEFYSLFLGDWNVNLIDLGDVISGNKLSE